MMRDRSCTVSVMTRNSSCKFRCAASASSLASSTSEDVSDVVSVRATYEHNLAVLRVVPVTSHRHLPTDDDLRCARAAVSAVLAVRARDRAGLSQFPELSAYGGLQQQPPSRDAAQRDEARPNARHDVVVPRGGWREGREAEDGRWGPTIADVRRLLEAKVLRIVRELAADRTPRLVSWPAPFQHYGRSRRGRQGRHRAR